MGLGLRQTAKLALEMAEVGKPTSICYFHIFLLIISQQVAILKHYFLKKITFVGDLRSAFHQRVCCF